MIVYIISIFFSPFYAGINISILFMFDFILVRYYYLIKLILSCKCFNLKKTCMCVEKF